MRNLPPDIVLFSDQVQIDSARQGCILRRVQPEARWQSGYAAACKAVYAGSIPTLASIFSTTSPGGGIGRRCGLKIRCSKGRAGSTPALGTKSAT